MRLISSVFVLLLCSLQASAQAVSSPLDESQIPVVVSGSSPIFDTVILSLISGLKAFHDSPAFMTVMYLTFALCMLIGITWRAVGLMYGEAELGQTLLWGFMRFCLGFGLFFMSLHLTFLLVGLQNSLAAGFLDASKALRPADSEYSGLLAGWFGLPQPGRSQRLQF